MRSLKSSVHCCQEIKKPTDGVSTIVGHVTRRISPLCLVLLEELDLSLHRGWYKVLFSQLPQGGLELPYKLMFIGPKLLDCKKMKKLVQSSLEMGDLEAQSMSANN